MADMSATCWGYNFLILLRSKCCVRGAACRQPVLTADLWLRSQTSLRRPGRRQVAADSAVVSLYVRVYVAPVKATSRDDSTGGGHQSS